MDNQQEILDRLNELVRLHRKKWPEELNVYARVKAGELCPECLAEMEYCICDLRKACELD